MFSSRAQSGPGHIVRTVDESGQIGGCFRLPPAEPRRIDIRGRTRPPVAAAVAGHGDREAAVDQLGVHEVPQIGDAGLGDPQLFAQPPVPPGGRRRAPGSRAIRLLGEDEGVFGQATAEGQQDGLLHDAVVSCTSLATVYEDEKPVHTVRLTKPFYLGKYEVTQAQWEAESENKAIAAIEPFKALLARSERERRLGGQQDGASQDGRDPKGTGQGQIRCKLAYGWRCRSDRQSQNTGASG